MERKLVYALAAFVIVIIIVSAFAYVENRPTDKRSFYLGVTYCGQSTVEAYQLVDRVKNFTNLFVIQSGPLQNNISALQDIGDYAVASGLDLIVYMGNYHYQQDTLSAFLNATSDRWGCHFLGVYFGDESGGKMLDAQVSLTNPATGSTVQKDLDAVRMRKPNSTNVDIAYFYSGNIVIETTLLYNRAPSIHDPHSTTTTYYPNGTVTLVDNYLFKSPTNLNNVLIYQQDGMTTLLKSDGSTSTVTDRGDISQFETYQQLWDARPIQTYDDAAELYIKDLVDITMWLRNQTAVKILTADYGLYWFDYKGGYDTVLAQIGPSENKIKEIALLRGAATMHGKDWGTILTWTSAESPTLLSGEEMFSDLKMAYEQGAKYAVVFNYAPQSDGVGLLQEEHFAAVEKFWHDVVKNPKITNGVESDVALVLPANYGWGMRHENDTVWGIWRPDDKAPQVWNALQYALADKSRLIDIVYDDNAYQLDSKYSRLLFWNQTS